MDSRSRSAIRVICDDQERGRALLIKHFTDHGGNMSVVARHCETNRMDIWRLIGELGIKDEIQAIRDHIARVYKSKVHDKGFTRGYWQNPPAFHKIPLDHNVRTIPMMVRRPELRARAVELIMEVVDSDECDGYLYRAARVIGVRRRMLLAWVHHLGLRGRVIEVKLKRGLIPRRAIDYDEL